MKLTRPCGQLQRLRAWHSPGYTLVELMIGMSISAVVLASLAGFTISGLRTIEHINTQGTISQAAGDTHGILTEQVRNAVGMSVGDNGNQLTLAFDDNPAVDSNGDRNPYNDTNRTALFAFRNGDGNDATTANNTFVFIPNMANTNQTRVLITGGVRKLPNLPVFSATSSNRAVQINLGVMDHAGSVRTQNIEVKTTLIRRN
jgi:prepilin-type N-terminal cleavage/methylation domain-containing protein